MMIVECFYGKRAALDISFNRQGEFQSTSPKDTSKHDIICKRQYNATIKRCKLYCNNIFDFQCIILCVSYIEIRCAMYVKHYPH